VELAEFQEGCSAAVRITVKHRDRPEKMEERFCNVRTEERSMPLTVYRRALAISEIRMEDERTVLKYYEVVVRIVLLKYFTT
jgi:hypothetical protein